MLRSHLAALGLASAVSLSFSLVACGGDDSAAPTPDGGDSNVGLPPGPGPEKPGDGPGAVFAISKLYLGDTDRSGVKGTSAWKKFGFNLDGKVSTDASTDLCKPRKGGKKSSVYPDGENGIDNAFGKTILPVIVGVAPDASKSVNESIGEGTFTIMFDIEKLGASADYNPLMTRLYGGGDLGGAPKWDGNDEWPILRELLDDPTDPTSTKVQFPKSYVTGNTWVSGSKQSIELNLGIQGINLKLTIGAALMAMDLDEAHKGAGNGTIAGVIDTEGFITELKKVAGNFSKDLCEGSTIDSIATQLEQASDIMKDGTAGDPSRECDGISIGLGFDAKVVKLGPITDPAGPPTDKCAEGGAGPGGGGQGGAGGG